MITLLKRHEIQVLLSAGHTQAEVARLAKVSERSVRRITAEAAVEHVDDRQERVERRIGRPRKVDRFRPLVEQLHQWLHETNHQRPNRATDEVPEQRRQQELERLRPLRELNEHARHWCRFAAFMARTEEAIGRLERIIERREQEGARERKEMNERWGNVANKMGTLVEDIVAPSIRRLAREVFDCGEQRYFGTRVSVNRSDDLSREREFDALYVGARAVLLNETKASPRTEYVQAFGGVSWRAASSRSTTRSTGRCR